LLGVTVGVLVGVFVGVSVGVAVGVFVGVFVWARRPVEKTMKTRSARRPGSSRFIV